MHQKKHTIIFICLVLTMLLLNGCGKKAADLHKAKDSLVICMGTRPPGFFDPKKRWGVYSQTQILHSALLKKTPELDIVGDYAKSYDVSENGKTWTFHLNDNFKFSNGEKVTAEDVKFTYEAMKKEYRLKGVKENTPQQLDTAKALFEKYFKTVYLN